MDEASLAGTNEMMMVDNGDLIPFTLHPEEVGLPTYSNVGIRGGNARENADILLSVLEGKESPYLDTVLLNVDHGLFANRAAQTVQYIVALACVCIAYGTV